MNTPALIASVDELVTAFAADAAKGSPLLPLATLISRLREPLREAGFWARVGDALLRNGFAEPAAALLGAALAHYPGDAALRYLRGNALRISQHAGEAEADFRAALALVPGHREAALSLAFMLREHGRIESASQALLGWWRHAGDGATADATLPLVEFLRESGAIVAARTLAQAAHERWPEHAKLAAAAGELALALGDFDYAHEALRGALQRAPALTSPWLRLSYCRRYASADDPDAALLRGAWNDAQLPRASRICAGFALGKLLDDVDDCAAATDVLREANALARGDMPWQAARWDASIERALAAAPLPVLDADPDFVPVFVVGLPRTGTTLIASRLGRLAGVRNRGELNWIGAMHDHLAAQNALRDRAALESVASLIRTQMRRDDAPARFYVDKNPLNFRYLDLILALFPNARVVHCRRGARDTALSLWSQHFAHPDLRFAYDFGAIATVAESERRLMAHWRERLPNAIVDAGYERFVADADAELERIARELDVSVAVDEAQTPAPITTASVWQARQPVHAQAVGRWRRYAAYVPELAARFAE